MKNQNGISLITLLVTIVLMLIITTMTLYSGFEAYDNMKVQAFVSKMRALQEKVDVFCDKYSVKEINEMGLSFSQVDETKQNLLQSVITTHQSIGLKSWSLVDDSTSNYRYFSIKDIEEKIGIKDFDVAIWLNPLTRNVIAEEGVKVDDVMYYRQYDLAGGQTLEQPVINSDTTLAYTVKTYDNKADIVLSKNFAKVTCYLKNGTSIVSTQVFTHVNTIPITESGTYQIIATDYDKSSSDYEEYDTAIKNQYAGLQKDSGDFTVTIVNKPLLVEGMTPIDALGKELNTAEERKDWYNYDSTVRNWANVKLLDGSIYVWVPRYAYKSGDTGIDIKFLRDFSNITTEGKALDNGYKVAPAFQDGSTLVPSGFVNGEWDSELSGFWVAKYEVTENDGFPMSTISSSVRSWTQAPIQAFVACRNLEKNDVLFGETVSHAVTGDVQSDGYFPTDTNNIDTHLMKNSEYGAVAYLTQSKYGNMNMKWQNGYYPGVSDRGDESTTTGTSTGIFGLAGGTPEITASGINIAGVYNMSDKNISTRYATVYTDNKTAYGDAINETEIAFWQDGITRTMPTASTPIFARGGETTTGKLFTYWGIGTTDNTTSTFRPVIVIDY